MCVICYIPCIKQIWQALKNNYHPYCPTTLILNEEEGVQICHAHVALMCYYYYYFFLFVLLLQNCFL